MELKIKIQVLWECMLCGWRMLSGAAHNFTSTLVWGLLLPAPPYHLPAPPYSRQIYHLTLFKIFHIPLYSPPPFLLLTASTNRRQKNVLRFVEAVRSKKNANASTVSTNRNVYYFYGFYKP